LAHNLRKQRRGRGRHVQGNFEYFGRRPGRD
jgi:hypothetical protein